MGIRRLISICLAIFLVFLILGCTVEKRKNDFELGKGYFQASDYKQAMIRLENWVQKSKNPNLTEAHAMLAVIYRNDEIRKLQFEAEVNKLKELGEPGMLAVLKLMENPTVASRLQDAIDDILVRGGALSVNPLMQVFKGSNWRLKVHAYGVLTKLGEPAVKPFTMTLNDPNPYTRSMSVEALGKMGDKSIVGLVEEKLKDPDELVRVTAAVALHSMGKPNPEKVITDALESTNVDARRAAAKAVAEIVENPPMALISKLVKDPDPDVRNYAIITIGKFRSQETVPILVKAIKEEKSEQVRSSASTALENIGEPAVAPLIELIKSTKDEGTIIRIAQILGNIGDKRAIEPLGSIHKKDISPLVKTEVAKALNKID